MDVAKWGHRKYTGPEFQPDHLFGVREHELYTVYQDHFEYFGNTEIEWIGKKGKKTIRHDWIIFDTVDEAMEFFNDRCGEFVGYYAYVVTGL